MNTTYNELLKTKQWRLKRLIILQRDRNKCRCCGSTNELQVHHRQYHVSKITGNFLDPWKYQSNHLITLCDKCHTAGHTKFKIPTFNI